MEYWLVIASVAAPVVMFLMQSRWRKVNLFYHVMAIVAAVVFGNISVLAIYRILHLKIVFMTDIHRVFLNPWFLLTGGYLGLYYIYCLIGRAMTAARNTREFF